MRANPRTGRTDLKSAFIEIDELEHCLHGAGWQADFGEALVQSLRAGIAPAALGHERVPDLDFVVGGLAAMRKCPLEQFLIVAALECFPFERRVIDFEKVAAARIKIRVRGHSAGGSPAFGQFPLLKQPNLVQHATEVNNPFDLIVRTSQPGYNSWI
jgi:hypothetical protein